MSLTQNFVTLNTYLCVEINAHVMVKFIRLIRDDKSLQKHVDIAPWLLSSQPCEQLFRSTRSMTSTFSTIVNFSLKDIMNRINKIEMLTMITGQLSNPFIYPRGKT